MSEAFLLGVDLGTTGVKVLLLPTHLGLGNGGEVEVTVEYPLSFPRPGWSEQNPEDWWEGAAKAIRSVLNRAGVDGTRIAGLALSGQMHGATLLDGHGAVLRPCILWNDQRSAPQCVEITDQVGLPQLLEWVGNPALAGFTAPKLLWVREHEPDVYARIATVLLPKDYINFRLTGQVATDYSDASGTLLFDVANRRWSDEMLIACAISREILPDALPSTAVVGQITAEAARITGLAAGTPVISGGADNACAAVGAGIIAAGDVLTSLGTSGTVVAPEARPQIDPRGRLHTFCHAVPDTWYLMGVVLSAGGSLRWFRDTLAADVRARAEAEQRDAYDLLTEEAEHVPAGSERLIFLPYLTGERTPHGDAFARGVFFGLSPVHSRGHLFRSVLEGVTFALADSVAIMRDLGMEVGTVKATGGGARNPMWRQILADVFEAPVLLAHANAGPALGAAVLAAVGIGMFASVSEATYHLAPAERELSPRADLARLYRSYHAQYDSLYPRLEENFESLAKLES
jgi:xylulokinase